MKEDIANQLFERVSHLEDAIRHLTVRTDLMNQLIALTAVCSNVPSAVYPEHLRLQRPTEEIIGLREVLEKEVAHIEYELNKVFSKVERTPQNQ
ncbi:hypothetical protein [Klebsiella quasipneumoniae]|uniref:hypothetical protein n=1 Tax=Klebsiella quasipneumoniae TaxID=1463165 RepID=UPI003DA0576F